MRQLEATHAAPRERIERELADRLAREARRSGASAGVSVKVPPPAPAMVVCESCGTSNETDARFCKECGTRLARGAAHA
jgi:hypothetical protein